MARCPATQMNPNQASRPTSPQAISSPQWSQHTRTPCRVSLSLTLTIHRRSSPTASAAYATTAARRTPRSGGDRVSPPVKWYVYSSFGVRIRSQVLSATTASPSTSTSSRLPPASDASQVCNRCGLFERNHGRPRPPDGLPYKNRKGPAESASQLAMEEHHDTPTPPLHDDDD